MTFRTLSSDRPIETPDEDKLGYQPFAENLARSVRRMVPPEGLVMALHGAWGTGKTSIINLLVRELEKPASAGEAEIVIVRFNPWWFSGEESLVSAFFHEVTAAIGDDLGNDVKEQLKKVRKRLSKLGGLIGAGLSFVPGAGAFSEVAREFIAYLGDQEESLEESRESLRNALLNQPKRVLIIIDDIDRVLPEEGRQIFKLVKSVADLPNVTYLLSFERKYAREIFGEGNAGAEFLEKVVQVPFDVPTLDRSALGELFLASLGEIIGESPSNFDETRWGNVFHDGIAPFLDRPRNVMRLLNAIQVAWPPIEGEVDIPDFIFLEAVRTFRPSTHQTIRENRDRFTGLRDREDRREDSGFYDKLINGEEEPLRGHLKDALMRVFPRLEGVWSNHGYTPEFLSLWRRARRVCAPEHFPTYFRLSLSEGVLSQATLDEFIARAGERDFVTKLILELAGRRLRGDRSMAERLLTSIQDYTSDRIRIADIPAIFRAMHDVGDQLLASHKNRSGSFEYGIEVTLGRLTWQLLRRLSRDERESLLEEIARDTPSLSLLVDELVVLGQQQGKYQATNPDPEDQWIVSAATLGELEKVAAKRLTDAANDGSLIDLPDLASILFKWRDWAGIETVKKWTSAVKSREDLLKVAKAFTSRSSSYAMGGFGGLGDRVVTETPRVHRATMGKLFDVSRIESEMKAIADSSRETEAHRRIASDFLEGLKHDDEERPKRVSDSTEEKAAQASSSKSQKRLREKG